MKLLAFAVVLGFSFAHAAESKGYLVKTNFEYQVGEKTEKSESTIVLDSANKGWNAVVPPKDGVSLLARLVENEGNTIKVEYLVVDSNKEQSVVSNPQIVTEIGKPALIETSSRQGRVLVGVTATAADYKKAR